MKVFLKIFVYFSLCFLLISCSDYGKKLGVLSEYEHRSFNFSWDKRIDGVEFIDQYNVCHIFAKDYADDDAYSFMGKEITRCFKNKSKHKTFYGSYIGQIKNITWYKVKEKMIVRYYDFIHDYNIDEAVGFYFVDKDICSSLDFQCKIDNKKCYLVVTDEDSFKDVIGHEVKHCFDGDFHDENENVYAGMSEKRPVIKN